MAYTVSSSPKGIAMQRNRFLPWFIGLAIILIADGYLLYFITDEGAPELAQQAAQQLQAVSPHLRARRINGNKNCDN